MKRPQGRPPKFAESVIREAFSRLLAGEKRAAVAADYGMSENTIARIARNQWPKCYGGEGTR